MSSPIGSTFAALADPTRLAVVEMLRDGPCRAGELAAQLGMTAPALSRHLKVLRKSGLITGEGLEDDARVTLYRIVPAAFAPLQDWLADLEAYWGGQLDAFKAHAERGASAKRRKRR